MRREFLQQCHKYDPKKHDLTGWYLSEKLDGMRCLWDGGITRGVPCSEVPWANTAKDHIRKEPPLSTGLWSRYGKAIHAPDWWLNTLPSVFLDGELYAGPGKFQFVMSTCRKMPPNVDVFAWERIQFHIFDSPDPDQFFRDGLVKSTHFTKNIRIEDCLKFGKPLINAPSFTELQSINGVLDSQTTILHPQKRIEQRSKDFIELELERVLQKGGEGLVFRNPSHIWTPIRSHSMLKYKPYNDSEGTVVGCTSGRVTDKGSKLQGLMGSLIVRWKGKEFGLSGFTDRERVLNDPDHAAKYPDTRMPDSVHPIAFPIGSKVTFKYRELSVDGVPKEARYHRKFQGN